MSGDDANGGDTTYAASSFEPSPGYTQTRYDPGTTSRTDVDVVMEDIEQQLSLRPADERASANRDKKLICMASLLVGFAVSVGVIMSRKGKSVVVSAEKPSGISLAAPPDYITSVCAPDMIDLKSGRAKCEELCEVAVCCFVPDTDKVSCLKGNEAVCKEYVAVCGNLDAETEKGEDSDEKKEEAAADQPDDTPTVTTKEDLIVYPADQPGDAPSTETTKQEVDSKCKGGATKTPEGLASCQGICSQAECCFAHGDEYCTKAGIDVDCVHFSACEVLHRGEDEDDDEDTGETAEDGAGAGAGATDAGAKENEDDAGAAGSPIETDDLKAAVDAACKDDVVSSAGGTAACEALCGPGSCCFSSGGQSCDGAAADDVDCGEYAACAVIFETDADADADAEDAPPPETKKEEVDSECMGDAAKTPEGLESCRGICSQAACCFAHGDEYCTNAGIDVDCVHFSACQILHRGENEDDGDDETDGDGTENATTATTASESAPVDDGGANGGDTAAADNIPADDNSGGGAAASKAQIDEACLQDLSDADWKMTCEQLCLAGKCCFDDPPSCDGAVECDDFGSCSRVYQAGDGGDRDSAEAVLADACSEAAVAMPGGRDTCREACVGSECCFPPPSESGAACAVDCDVYSPCSLVMGGGADGDEGGEMPAEAGEDAAEAAETGSPESAGEEEKGGDDGESTLEIAEKVIETCSAERLNSEVGRADCEKLCINHLCCFATENDCREALGSECIEYAACNGLIDWSSEP